MADICLIYASEDEGIAERLVEHLRRYWTVWWGGEITHGPWDETARKEIESAKAVLPLLSGHINGKHNFRGELEHAVQLNKPIFPFRIDHTDVPLPIKHFNRTDAIGWASDGEDKGLHQLRNKLVKLLGEGRGHAQGAARPAVLAVRDKKLDLPAFIFSLSSHETQVAPVQGATLLGLLEPGAVLVSAYDAWKYYQRNTEFKSVLKDLRRSDTVLVLDSGNYEAYRKDDRHSPKKNPTGWDRNDFLETVGRISPDIAFSFDSIRPFKDSEQIADAIIRDFRKDNRALAERDFLLCPIIHIPDECGDDLCGYATRVAVAVATVLDPPILAIPERELGSGLRERARTVRAIRKALNAIGKYYPLHLLGTGNPLSMVALAAAGADSFDGLEWCRTVADYSTGHLFHFQHFDCFERACLHRIHDQSIRHLVENTQAPYTVRALAYNVDFFKDWTRTMRNMIHSGQIEPLLNNIPNIGINLFKELFE